MLYLVQLTVVGQTFVGVTEQAAFHLGKVIGCQAVALHLVGIEIDEGIQPVRLAFHHNRLAHIVLVVQYGLNLLRVDVLSVGGEYHALAAPFDVDVAFAVHEAEVAGMQVAVVGECSLCGRLVFVIAYAYVVAFGLNLANNVGGVGRFDAHVGTVNSLAAAVKTFFIAEMIKEKSNNRPRKKMGFLTPYEYFFSTFAKINV